MLTQNEILNYKLSKLNLTLFTTDYRQHKTSKNPQRACLRLLISFYVQEHVEYIPNPEFNCRVSRIENLKFRTCNFVFANKKIHIRAREPIQDVLREQSRYKVVFSTN